MQFRRWASTVLKEYLLKGFAMDDERLKNPDGRSRRSSAISLWLVALAASIWMGLTMCACGHTSWPSSIGLYPALGYASYLLFKIFRPSKLEQILAAAAFAAVAMMVIKNVVDLFSGHP